MVDNYVVKTYAGWLGKIIGIRLGSHIEGWTYEKIREEIGEISDYPVDYNDYAADDDSNGPFFFIKALEDFTCDPEELTPAMVGKTWLNYVSESRGFFWWGGYGISTEHTAYDNLKNGLEAPRSGSMEQNGSTCAEQIGGQIFIDSCGYVAPGRPYLAARFARTFASVSHDGNGIYGAVFVAVCISLAYIRHDIRTIIEEALTHIPESSEYFRVARKVIEFYDRDKGQNWRDCFSYIHDNFGYDKYPGNCHIIPNSAVMVLAMLYGKGDFSETICIVNMCGWDTDCNGGNVGSILGILSGIENMDDKWITPIKDIVLYSSCLGSLNISTASRDINTYCRLGYRIAHEVPPAPWKEIWERDSRLFHFHLPKSLQGMRTDDEGIFLSNTDEVSRSFGRCLKIDIQNRGPEVSRPFRVYRKTYYQPADLYDSRYDPSFTPVLYPGQTVKSCLCYTGGSPLKVCLYGRDINNNALYSSPFFEIREEWTEIDFTLPPAEGALIKEAGFLFESGKGACTGGAVYIDYVEYTGKADFTIDFSRERTEEYIPGHTGIHREISQFSQKSGLWELDGEYLSGSCCESGEAYTGLYRDRDYIYDIIINPQYGETHLMNFRVQGGERSYAFGFCGRNRLALLKKNHDYTLLKDIEYPYERYRDYAFSVRVEGEHILCSVEGETLIDFLDEADPLSHGQIGMSVHGGSHCHYKNLRYRRTS